jgi:hypothetical protein
MLRNRLPFVHRRVASTVGRTTGPEEEVTWTGATTFASDDGREFTS